MCEEQFGREKCSTCERVVPEIAWLIEMKEPRARVKKYIELQCNHVKDAEAKDFVSLLYISYLHALQPLQGYSYSRIRYDFPTLFNAFSATRWTNTSIRFSTSSLKNWYYFLFDFGLVILLIN